MADGVQARQDVFSLPAISLPLVGNKKLNLGGFTRSHWMPLLGENFCHITPAAAIILMLVRYCVITCKKTLLASTYCTKQWTDLTY